MSDHIHTASPTGLALNAAYSHLWESFADSLRAHASDARTWAATTDDPLHPVLRAAYWTPKHFLQEGTRANDRAVNVGSATGLFFEYLAATLIGTRLERRVSGAFSHRNRVESFTAVGPVPQQPDLLVVNPATGRAAAFEFKAAPKRRDVDAVRAQQASWVQAGASFFFVGGFAGSSVARALAADWAAILRTDVDGPDLALVGQPSVDDLIEAAERHLLGA